MQTMNDLKPAGEFTFSCHKPETATAHALFEVN